jgi:hypothetical protein
MIGCNDEWQSARSLIRVRYVTISVGVMHKKEFFETKPTSKAFNFPYS